jgi:hypothetical protein
MITLIIVGYFVLVTITVYNINEVLWVMNQNQDPLYAKFLIFLIRIGFTPRNTMVLYIVGNIVISLLFSVLVLVPCMIYLIKHKKNEKKN